MELNDLKPLPLKIASKLMREDSAVLIKTSVHRDRHVTIRAVMVEDRKAGAFLVFVEETGARERDAFYFAECITDALAIEHAFYGAEGLETNG
jgi:hypothetical protein